MRKEPNEQDDIFEVDGEQRVAMRLVLAEQNIDLRTLTGRAGRYVGWEDDCPYLGNKPFEPKPRAKNPNTGRNVITYSKAQYDQIKAKREEVKAGRFVNPVTKEAWLSFERSVERLEKLSGKKWKLKSWHHYLAHYWRNDPNDNYVHLDGEKLRAHCFGFLKDTGGKQDLWYLEEHIERIGKSLAGKPIEVFEKPDGRRLTITKAAKVAGYSPSILYEWIDALPSEFAGLFSEGKLPSELEPPSSKRGRFAGVATVLETDVTTLVEGIKTVLQAIRLRIKGRLETERQFLDGYGVSQPNERCQVLELLTDLREQGIIHPEHLLVETPANPARRWGHHWHFSSKDRVELDRYLNGRNIVEVAAEFCAARTEQNGKQVLEEITRETVNGGANSNGDGQPTMPITPAAEHSSLTVQQAATVADVPRGTISRAVDEGRLKSNGESGHARRIDKEDLIRWILHRSGRAESAENMRTVRKLVAKHCD